MKGTPNRSPDLQAKNLLSASSHPIHSGSDINADFVPAYSCEGSVDFNIELPDIRACTFDTRAVSINLSGLSSTEIS